MRNSLLLNSIMYFSIIILILLLAYIPWIWVKKRVPQCIHTREDLRALRQNKMQHHDTNHLEEHTDHGLEPSEQHTLAARESVVEQEPVHELGYLEIIKILRPEMAAYCLNNIITYMLYPEFVTGMRCVSMCTYTSSKIYNSWWNLGILTVHVVCDFLGRMLPKISAIQRCFTLRVSNVTCYVRLVCIVWFTMANFPRPVADDNGTITQKPILHIDWLNAIAEAIFSFTQTFALTTGLMQYQNKLPSSESKAKGAVVMMTSTQLGLALGGFAALGVVLSNVMI